MSNQYDSHAKALWIKVYQDVLTRTKGDSVYAKDIANQAVAHYMAAFGADSDLKKNFTTESSVQNLHGSNLIEVPFKVDEEDEIILQNGKQEYLTVAGYCYDNNIDQKRIKRILLEMKTEDE